MSSSFSDTPSQTENLTGSIELTSTQVQDLPTMLQNLRDLDLHNTVAVPRCPYPMGLEESVANFCINPSPVENSAYDSLQTLLEPMQNPLIA